MSFTEHEMERGDRLHDEQRDREMEKAMERDEVADILRNSLPVAVEPAPPVPQRLLDEASAKFMRETPAASRPRFFRHADGTTWEFRNGAMTTNGEDSIYKSPDDILECLDVVETDFEGNDLPS